MIRHLARSLVRQVRSRRNAASLQALSDHQLADIGLVRGDILHGLGWAL